MSCVFDCKVFFGSVFTVAGMLLQNNVLFRFYCYIWGCVGFEMEGMYYLCELLKVIYFGIIFLDVDMCFVYYVLDVLFLLGETLAGVLCFGEGILFFYAITCEVFVGVLVKK